MLNRDGSLCWRTSSQSEVEGIWSRYPIDAGEVRAFVFLGTKERLSRCGGNRRSSPAANHEVCSNEDCRTARLAGPASRARNALANKLARIAWAVLAGNRTFEASKVQVA
jgi:hypothetical protein